MIDWITAVIPCRHKRIENGRTIKLDHNGELVFDVANSRRFEGTWESSLVVCSNKFDDDLVTANYIFLDGNPAKFLQGHNI